MHLFSYLIHFFRIEEFKNGYVTTEGQRTWLALFQGRPTAQEGNLIKREWWKFYKKEELPHLPVVALSIDATFKDKDTSDYVAIQVWGKRENNYYLVDRLKARLDFIDTITAINKMLQKHKNITYKYIEDKANGSAIISVLRNKIDGIIAVEPEGGKVARANAISYLIEAGNVYLPQDEEWVEEFIDEWSKFPNAEHDDEVDCGTQALNKMRMILAHAPEDTLKYFNFSFEKPKPNLIGRGDRQNVI